MTEVADTIRKSGGEASCFKADVTDEAAVATLEKEVLLQYAAVDILINNAGGSPPADTTSAPHRFTERIVALNLLAPIYVSQRANHHMQTQDGGGAIVNVSGRGGRQPTPAHLPGSCANIAVNTLTKGLADVYGPHNIRINAVAPGPMTSSRTRPS